MELMEALDHQIKRLILILLKETQNYDNSYMFVNEREIFKFKVDNKDFNFQTFQVFVIDLVLLGLEKYL